MAAILMLAAKPVPAANVAEAALLRAIQADSNLSTMFSKSSPQTISEARAEVVTENASNRYAAVAFRPVRGDSGASTGRMFCHAALLRPDAVQITERIVNRIDDRLVAEEFIRRSTASATIRRVQDKLVAGDDGWATAVCEVVLTDLSAPQMPVINAETMASASYDVAKAQFKAGRRDEALERFRQLRTSTAYVNAVLYVVVLLSPTNPDLAAALRTQVVDLDKVTDMDALAAYADAMASIGEVDAENRARQLFEGRR
ncbi:MAG TPA: hypothetical protein VK558_19110 [Patescibacteria group bacterium]|nr:hypothetical protein [Patescibacteria group bacterium]